MFELKPLSQESVPKALERAIHYRLLNEPWQAESICRDILMIEPENEEVLVTLILSITDQFGSKVRTTLPEALEPVAKLSNMYQKNYYSGLVYERQGTVALNRSTPRAKYIAYEHYRKAMDWYEKAELIRPEKNEDSKLRWNACVRMINERKLEPAQEDHGIQPFLDV